MAFILFSKKQLIKRANQSERIFQSKLMFFSLSHKRVKGTVFLLFTTLLLVVAFASCDLFNINDYCKDYMYYFCYIFLILSL